MSDNIKVKNICFVKYGCKDCTYNTNIKKYFTKYKYRHNKDVIYKCDKCTYISTNKYNLYSHNRIHKNNHRQIYK